MSLHISMKSAALLSALLLTGAIGAYAAASGGSTPPIARYDMKAGTISGMGAMGAPGAGGARGGIGSAMSMMMGGGRNAAQHELTLELGSSLAPSGGAPKADHFIPTGMNLGPSLALKTPIRGSTPSRPDQFQRPKLRVLIFWGCGEHAPKGQPVVIDFSKLTPGSVPPGLFSSSVPADNWVTEANSRTYGRWPGEDGKFAKPNSALPGAHRVVANYAPEMDFTLVHDFMAPLRASSAGQPSGATLLNWNALPDATGYYAWVMGGKGDGQQMQDVVWWSSSATREFGGGLTDWLSPGTVARLVANRTVLSPQTTTCTVPAEVKQASPNFQYGMIYAYGPEETFVYPPRPKDPKIAWHPQWEARIRHRSMTGMLMGVPGMEGMNAGGMADADEGDAPSSPKCQPKKKKKGLGGLGSMIGSAISGQLPGQPECQ